MRRLSLAAAAAFFLVERGAFADDLAGLGALSAHEVVLAEGAVAVTAADLDGDGRADSAAAFPGGVLIETAAGSGTFLPHAARALAPGAALPGGGRELLLALDAGVILAMDVVSGRERIIAALDATALASGDVDGDGALEVFAAAAGNAAGNIVAFGADGRELDPVAAEEDAFLLAAGDFLGRGYDQLALGRLAGTVEVIDLAAGDSLLLAAPPLLALAPYPAGNGAGLYALITGAIAAEIDVAGGPHVLFAPGPESVTHHPPFAVLRLKAPAARTFVRGNVNGDAKVDISDGIAILLDLFLGVRAKETCRKSLDVDDSGALEITDAISLLLFLFANGPAPPPPYPAVGTDGTPDGLACPP